MKTFVEIGPGGKTPSGLVLPNRSKPVRMEVEIPYQTEQLWEGILNFNKPQTVEKRIPQNTNYRTELIFLILKFITYHKQNRRTNSSLSMLVHEAGEYILLNVGKTAKRNELFCQLMYNVSEKTIQRLIENQQTYPDFVLPQS